MLALIAELPLSSEDVAVNRVCAIAVAPSGRRIAVATVDRVVSLFDEWGAKRDKFATKPTEMVRHSRPHFSRG